MKRRLFSFLLCLVMVLSLLPVLPVRQVHAATTSQLNIVARANYLYNATWVCRKNVAGWRGTYTFIKGNTYHIPYGQPVYAGAYVGFGVSVDDYLAAAANASSVFYTSQSNYAGKTSTYYATDCSAYVSWSWGTARQTTATIPNMSTYIGTATLSNINSRLQLGDCLNSNSAGHVVLVTGLTYNASGTLTQIEITEQTPPQLKKSSYTPSTLASKYSGSYSIYRYTGTVPAAPDGASNTTSFGVKVSEKLKNWVFNATYYKNAYNDLAGMTDTQLYAHYLQHGITEGRQASALFNIKYYLNQNTDLKGVYGSDYEAAFEHFVVFGQYESSRVYSKQLTAIKDQIFDPTFYCKKYPSVYESFGDDTGRLFANFIKTGLSKGYSASPVFDVSAYIKENSGLTSLYSKDYYGAIHHFISNGQNESRVVSPILDTAYYTATYEDAAGMTALAAMKHFLSTGIPEGRRGTKSFLPEFYYFNHEDKLTGYTVEDCFMHYALSGYDEGLLAAPYAMFPETHADLGAGFTAKMTNLKSGLNWSISGTNVIIYTPSESDAQKWKFVRQPDGSYEITNVKYGTVLTTSDNGSADGVITIAEDVDGTNQRWYLYEVGGYYSFRTACNQWVSIGLTGGETTSGNTVEMANFRDNNAQKYTIAILSVDAVECTQHNYLSSVTTAPTCTTDGVTTYTCVNCADSYTQVLEATGHDYDCVVTEVDCTTDGVTTYTCANCGDSYTENEIAATGHDWQDASCTEAKTCRKCALVEGEPLGHSYETVEMAPTCEDEGYTSYTCATCGDTYAIPGAAATGHSFSGWVRTKAPTCTIPGQLERSCAGCGLVEQQELPAPGHKYAAVVTAPTCTTDGYTTYTCSTCGDSYTGDAVVATGHSYVSGRCSGCGISDPNVVRPTLALKYPSLSFESEIVYNVYFVAEGLDDTVELGLLTFDSAVADGNVENADGVIPGYVTDGSIWKVSSNGIAAKDLGDDLYFMVYAKLIDGSYVYTSMKSYNAVSYANTILGRASSSAYMKSLVVAMLEYGAQAQLFFGYKTDSLMDAGLTEEQRALTANYDGAMMDDVVAVDSAKAGSVVYDGSSYVRRAPSVSFDGAFAINYYFTTARVPEGDVKLYYWTLADYEAAQTLKPGNATGKVIMTATDVTNQYWGQVGGIAAKGLDQTVFVAGFYTSGGVTYSTGVLNYSIGKYCEGIAAKDGSEQQALAQATAVYGYYAKEYFANL